MKPTKRNMSVAALLLALTALLVLVEWTGPRPALDAAVAVDLPAQIFPDYAGAIIPPNIAPLNFVVEEPGEQFALRVLDRNGLLCFEVLSRDNVIRLPIREWRQTIRDAKGEAIRMEIFARDSRNAWRRFSPFTLRIATQRIDEYLVYRRIHPAYNYSYEMTISQRHVGSYETAETVRNSDVDHGCINCHTLSPNHPSHMLLQLRRAGHPPSMIIATEEDIVNVEPSPDERVQIPTFASWHPNGELIALSRNTIRQFFHTAGAEPRDVVDMGGDLAVYRVSDGAVMSSPKLVGPEHLLTYPQWSSDGKHLYFCRAEAPWETPPRDPLDGYPYWPRVQYDLVRVGFDPETALFGEVEILLSHEQTGLSMTEPRPSPDGRWLVFVGHEYGSFPAFQEDADLWILNLLSGEARPLSQINSNAADSWPNWSQNGRWLAFSSKREGRALSRPYFSYVDENGEASKPVLLPQEDPNFYRRDWRNFNLPTLSPHPPPSLDRLELDESVVSPSTSFAF